jgi:hypothetical protein
LGISIGLNSVSSHAACTAVFVAVAAVLGFVFSSIRTLGKIGWLAWVGLFCILTASKFTVLHRDSFQCALANISQTVFCVTIAVGVQDRPAAAPEGPWESNYKIIGSPNFVDGISAVSSHIFAFAGTPAFFSIAAEMREPKHYTRSLLTCQTIVTVTYITIGTVVYYYCGSYVASPALGSAGAIMKKVCYGLALPGLIVTTMIVTHVSFDPTLQVNTSRTTRLANHTLKCRYPPSISSSDSFEAHPISTPTALSTGAPGLPAPEV